MSRISETAGLRAASVTRRQSTLRHLAFAVITVVASTLVCLLAAELVLRFMPVATGMRSQPVNAAQPVFRFEPNREFLYSRDWYFSIVNRGRVNNDGFVNDRDYVVEDSRPLLAIVGDSNVEAAMVPNRETFYGRLATDLGARGRVYSFAAAGAPMSQYLAWVRYAVEKYRPQGIVIVIISNDFDESLLRRPGFHWYAKDSAGQHVLVRNDYAPGLFRDLVVASALGRYVIFNLNGLEILKQWWARFGGLISPARADMPQFVGNTASDTSPQRVAESYAVIEAFFRDLPEATRMPPERIAFIVDGARYPTTVDITERSYFGLMRNRFISEAARRGYEVIDMQPRFVDRSRDGRTFYEFPTDGHWNPTAHGLIADALKASTLFGRIFNDR